MTNKADCFSHDKETNPSINICLNCKKAVCRGTCELVTQNKREYVIRRIFLSKKGEMKISYITHVGPKYICTSQDIEKARRFTQQAAKELIPSIKLKAGPQSKFDAVKA